MTGFDTGPHAGLSPAAFDALTWDIIGRLKMAGLTVEASAQVLVEIAAAACAVASSPAEAMDRAEVLARYFAAAAATSIHWKFGLPAEPVEGGTPWPPAH